MIITRTPLRISFVGGGTDIKEYYQHANGQVLSTAINKYVYVIVKKQLGIVEYKYRINWSQIELKNHIDEINHPIVREVLRKFNINYPIEITTVADIPAGTGLGSSSSFAVGLIHAICALEGLVKTKYELASLAAEIEVDILGRDMGKQDHFAAAYGNLNMISFFSDERVEIEPVIYDEKNKDTLENNLLLFYTFMTRDAAKILKSQIKATINKFDTLTQMKDLVDPLSLTLKRGNNTDDFGKILHQNWMLKKSLTSDISNSTITKYYEKGLEAGALGGKLLGAGSGGFILFYIRPEAKNDLLSALSDLYPLSFKFDQSGTRITYYDRS
jgi:D-glycero-alpha-D-manno-heptose-7-phosphate kinase